MVSDGSWLWRYRPSWRADATHAVLGDRRISVAEALETADVVDTLNGKGPFTVFAPTDDAFCPAPAGDSRGPVQAGEQSQLRRILSYDVVPDASRPLTCST